MDVLELSMFGCLLVAIINTLGDNDNIKFLNIESIVGVFVYIIGLSELRL